MSWIRQHRATVAVGAIVGVVLAAWLAFGVFGIHTLFFDEEVDEAGPVFDSGASVVDTTGGATTTSDAAGGPPSSASSSPTTTTTPPTPVVEEVATGTFVDRSHPARGRAVVLSDGLQTFLRFEDFETDNGPDLFVYLSRGTTADGPEGAFDDDFVDLGTLKGNIGDQNYEVPADVDVSEYSTVVVWCRRFAVAFGAADLT